MNFRRHDSTDSQLSAAGHDLRARLDLARSAYRLKDEERKGWVLRGVEAPESVADHSWGTAILCQLFAVEAGVDRERAVAIALLHDIAEAITGDVIARVADADREVSVESKAASESSAIAQLLSPGGPVLEEVRELWKAYEDRSDPAAKFVRDMNLVDMCIQAMLYERQRRYDPNVVIPSQGAFERLDEFFISAEQRIESKLARELLNLVKQEYQAARNDWA